MSESNKSGFFRDLITGVVSGITGLVTNKHPYQHIGQIRNQAKAGDILEFQRGSYTHYALYLGDGKILNIDVENQHASEACIRERTLQEVCDGCKVRLSGHEDIAQTVFHVSAKPDEDIVCAALAFKNKVVPYEFDFRNCEYYCTLWRYGKGFSTQVAQQAVEPVEAEDAADSSATCGEGVGYDKYLEFARSGSGAGQY